MAGPAPGLRFSNKFKMLLLPLKRLTAAPCLRRFRENPYFSKTLVEDHMAPHRRFILGGLASAPFAGAAQAAWVHCG